jgi:serine/threonine protein kinase
MSLCWLELEEYSTPFEKKQNHTQAEEPTPLPPLSASPKDERYEIVKTLGEGGMGVVYLVFDQVLGREVALKKIKIEKSKNIAQGDLQKVMLWRLKQEAEITAILEHPNIIPLYDLQTLGKHEFQFTMRKVEGETLRALLKKKRQGLLKELPLLSIFLKICDALAYAHSKGVLHRDLKPENIMVGSFEEVYVMDWGIAKKLENKANSEQSPKRKQQELLSLDFNVSEEEVMKTVLYATKAEESLESLQNFKTRGGLGTQEYMAPEQYRDASQVTPQADIYSLGKILRECFLLLSPLEELQEQIKLNTLKMKSSSLPQGKVEVASNKKLPLDIVAIAKKATEEEPEKRYNTIEEFTREIERYQRNLKISARNYTKREVIIKWAERNRKRLFLLGVISIIALFTAVLVSQQKNSQIRYHLLLTKAKESLFINKDKTKAFQYAKLAYNSYHQDPKAIQEIYRIFYDKDTHFSLTLIEGFYGKTQFYFNPFDGILYCSLFF